MKSIKQLIRQPLKFIAGIFLVSLAIAISTIGVGQYTATDLSRENLDDRYTTIGLLSSDALMEITDHGVTYFPELPEETQKWVDWLIWNRQDIVREVSSTGLVSAHIPDLNIDNFSSHMHALYDIDQYNKGYPYRCAMMTVTLTKISEVAGATISKRGVDSGIQKLQWDTTYLCLGTVESVIGLEQGFESPVGKTILLYVKVFSPEDFDALNLQVGQTYLVYGEDYCDIPRFDFLSFTVTNHTYDSVHKAFFGELQSKNGMPNYDPWVAQFDCTLTICDPASLPTYTPVYDETGMHIIEFAVAEDLRELSYYEDDTVFIKWVPEDEYTPYYQLPAIVPLNGSADDFLASEDGALWREALDKMEINNHGFPVLCVDKLGYQAAFTREQARIVDGRDFTEAELLNGEKVCILSQSVAAESGVKVGDTIELQTYAYDPEFSFQEDEMWMSGAFPSAALYSEALGFTSEIETYTIVGLYRQEDAWQNSYDSYGFTPNTIFVPKSSVTAEMDLRNKGIYSTLVIENGKMEEFKALMEEAGYPDLFVCYDQGYSEFMASLDAYEDVSEKALYIGLAAYAILMLLFVFLFPMAQRKALVTMLSLGTHRGKRIGHIVISSAVILLPGTLIGAFAGSKLWTQVADRLMQSLNIEIPLEANMPMIAPTLAVAHLLLMALVILVTAIILTQNNSIMMCK